MSATMVELVQRTVARLSMVPGMAVQVYAEDRIAEMIWHKFVIVLDELWWDDFMVYQTLTQDAAGRPVENVVRELPLVPTGDEIVIGKYADIQHVWTPNNPYTLKSLPRRTNPTSFMRSGRTMYRMADADKVIRVVPFSAGATFTVRYKQSFARFQPNSIVPMDDQVLILGACYDYLEDDGTNQGQTEKFRNLFNDRLRQLKDGENDAEIPLSPPMHHNTNGYQVIS